MSAVFTDQAGVFVTETSQRSGSVIGAFITETTGGGFVDLAGSITTTPTLAGAGSMILGLSGDIAPAIQLLGDLPLLLGLSGAIAPTIQLAGDITISSLGVVDLAGGVTPTFTLAGNLTVIPFVPPTSGNAAAALMIGV